ncbi:MAG: transposase [Gammaproteobacteria bacterium]|jgi:putative transposase
MPRRARLTIPGIPWHIIQRGNNRSACFYSDEDYLFYLSTLEEQARKYGCAIHAYCLMTNHVHLLITPERTESAGQVMKHLGQRYVQYINRTCRRSGTLWEGRFRSCLVQEENYLLTCYRYIELNPVRANMVDHPADYRWSSYRFNGQGSADTRLTPHLLYQALGSTIDERCKHYRELFRHHLEPGLVDEIRQATNGNYALGNSRFTREIETKLQRRVIPGNPGRPIKTE